VALNILLVPRYGVVGAIAARLCSMSVRSAVIFVAARRSLRGANAAAGAGNQ
jgi:O-antigen/teichoic acid export membrane protein